jgi:hypothetical protein
VDVALAGLPNGSGGTSAPPLRAVSSKRLPAPAGYNFPQRTIGIRGCAPPAAPRAGAFAALSQTVPMRNARIAPAKARPGRAGHRRLRAGEATQLALPGVT